MCQLSFIVIKKGIDKYQVHNTARLTELLYNKTPYDILFLGSSRVHLGIDPAIIDSVCKVNSYNGGIDGAGIFEFKMIFLAYLENHPPPKYLVLTLDLHSFASSNSLFNYPEYFSFLKNTVINNYLNECGYSTLKVKLFPFLEMSDYDDNTKGYFIKGLLGQNEIPVGDFEYKGYLSNSENYISPIQPIPPLDTLEVSPIARNYLADIFQICKDKNIQVILAYSPSYDHKIEQHHSNTAKIFSMIDSFAVSNKSIFLRGDNLELCSNPKLFANAGHLNKEGGREYSLILAEEINEIMKGNNPVNK